MHMGARATLLMCNSIKYMKGKKKGREMKEKKEGKRPS